MEATTARIVKRRVIGQRHAIPRRLKSLIQPSVAAQPVNRVARPEHFLEFVERKLSPLRFLVLEYDQRPKTSDKLSAALNYLEFGPFHIDHHGDRTLERLKLIVERRTRERDAGTAF
jgi:hypothetical protein